MAQRRCYDVINVLACSVVKLRHNFRNHIDIMRFSNDQLYSSELIASADPMLTQRLLKWEKLPNPKFPILFRGMIGTPLNRNLFAVLTHNIISRSGQAGRIFAILLQSS